jgi:hypothetical protein
VSGRYIRYRSGRIWLKIIALCNCPLQLPRTRKLSPSAYANNKGLEDGVENWRFSIKSRAVLSDEGLVSVKILYPEGLEGLPWSLSIDDVPVSDSSSDFYLKEGEHLLTVHSEDYRTEHRNNFGYPGNDADSQHPTPGPCAPGAYPCPAKCRGIF